MYHAGTIILIYKNEYFVSTFNLEKDEGKGDNVIC